MKFEASSETAWNLTWVLLVIALTGIVGGAMNADGPTRAGEIARERSWCEANGGFFHGQGHCQFPPVPPSTSKDKS